MRKLFVLAAAVGLAALSFLPMAAQAEDGSDEATLCSYCWKKGSFTEENPEASHVLLFPVRVTTAVVGAPIGALHGMATGTVDAVEATSKATFGNIKTTKYDPVTNTTLTILKAPLLAPVGLVGTAVAVPVGMTYGAVAGTFHGIAKGYMFPDTF